MNESKLIEAAGVALAAALRDMVPPGAAVVVFTGKGHNAADGFVIARELAAAGHQVQLRMAFPEKELRPLAREKWQACKSAVEMADLFDPPPAGALVMVDALLGIGASGELRGPLRAACQAWHHLAACTAARRVAIDLPSGLCAETGAAAEEAIVADDTLAIGWWKKGLVADGAEHFTGRLHLVPLPELDEPEAAPLEDLCLTPDYVRAILPRPSFSRHKGEAGRVVILAGSPAMTGAAVLTARGALAGGGGLVTVCCPADAFPFIRARCPDEVMVRPVSSALELSDLPADVLALGPGLGGAPPPHLVDVILHSPRPAVIDADALNALAAARAVVSLREAPAPRLLAPHPGEMARLAGALNSQLPATRRETALRFSAELNATLLLKGARSVIATAGQPVAFNTTGHPAMATGGCGDVLTGVCAALIARGLIPHHAACAGSWLIGRAAELCLAEGGTFSPTSMAQRLGRMVQTGEW